MLTTFPMFSMLHVFSLPAHRFVPSSLIVLPLPFEAAKFLVAMVADLL